ncbi:MAG: lipoprotein [Wolbachia sp.]
MFKKLLFFVLAVFMLSGCSLSKQRKLKSPCIKVSVQRSGRIR